MFVLALIGVPVLEILVFIEVGRAIGWLAAIVLLIATSLVGVRLLRVQGRSAIEGVSLAVAEQRSPGRAVVYGALGFLGSVLLVVPGFVTDLLGVLLVLPPTRSLTRRWISHHYGSRAMSFLASAGRFTPGGRPPRPADVDSTAIDDDLSRLDR
jgi:UPF0716 protein FxsA